MLVTSHLRVDSKVQFREHMIITTIIVLYVYEKHLEVLAERKKRLQLVMNFTVTYNFLFLLVKYLCLFLRSSNICNIEVMLIFCQLTNQRAGFWQKKRHQKCEYVLRQSR